MAEVAKVPKRVFMQCPKCGKLPWYVSVEYLKEEPSGVLVLECTNLECSAVFTEKDGRFEIK